MTPMMNLHCAVPVTRRRIPSAFGPRVRPWKLRRPRPEGGARSTTSVDPPPVRIFQAGVVCRVGLLTVRAREGPDSGSGVEVVDGDETDTLRLGCRDQAWVECSAEQHEVRLRVSPRHVRDDAAQMVEDAEADWLGC